MRFSFLYVPPEPVAALVKFLDGAVQVFRVKSGQSTFIITYSEYADCHSRKLLTRISPGRPDNQLRIGYARRVKIPGENILGQCFRSFPAATSAV